MRGAGFVATDVNKSPWQQFSDSLGDITFDTEFSWMHQNTTLYTKRFFFWDRQLSRSLKMTGCLMKAWVPLCTEQTVWLHVLCFRLLVRTSKTVRDKSIHLQWTMGNTEMGDWHNKFWGFRFMEQSVVFKPCVWFLYKTVWLVQIQIFQVVLHIQLNLTPHNLRCLAVEPCNQQICAKTVKALWCQFFSNTFN